MDIAVIGSNNVDLISYIDRMPDNGETLEAPDFQLGAGGKGANQAMAARWLGSEVLMVTRVGSDLFADNTIKNFEDNGIDTKYVIRTEGTSGVAPIFVDKDSNNRIIIIKGANAKLSAADIDDAAEDIKACKLIVLQLEIDIETVYYAIEFGKSHDIPVLLNPAPADPNLDMDRVKDCTYFVPNETELALLTDMPVESEEDIEAAARKLLDAGINDVIVTLGSRGALWVNGNDAKLYPSEKVDAVDTTGAGDAFIGCFSHVLVQTGDIDRAITIANRYAADSVTKRGTQTSYATAEEFGLGL